MIATEDKINTLNNLITESLLPELCKDIGEFYLTATHFNDFRKHLDINFIRLFDLIQQNEMLLYTIETDTLELRCKLLLLLCEQSASGSLYQTQNQDLLKNINLLIEKHFMNILNQDHKVFEKILDYYANRLNALNWKRNLGAVHGFIRFCELYYEKNSQSLNSKTATFLLSVGLLLRDFYEPSHKEFGYELFYIILQKTPEDVIEKINIQNVVYDAVFADLKKVDTEKGTKYIMNCIIHCLKFFKISAFHKWNKIDDLISEIIRRMTLTSNIQVCIFLFFALSQVILHFSQNSNGTKLNLQFDDVNFPISHEMITNLRDKCSEISCYASFRWSKKFLQLCVAESNYLKGNPETCYKLIQAMHIFYLTCIYPIPVNILDNHLKEFFNKFPFVLAEVLQMNKKEPRVVKAVKNWFVTFQKQIDEYKSK